MKHEITYKEYIERMGFSDKFREMLIDYGRQLREQWKEE